MIDGGSTWNSNIISAIDRCRTKVDSDSKIVVDYIFCFHHSIAEKNATQNAFNNYLRFGQIQSYQKSMHDVYEVQRANPEVQYRYFVMPSAAHLGNMMDFSNRTTGPAIELGKSDGLNAIQQG